MTLDDLIFSVMLAPRLCMPVCGACKVALVLCASPPATQRAGLNMIDQLTTREVATLIWLLAIIIWALTKPDIRRAARKVVLAFCQPKILTTTAVMALYTSVVVALLSTIGLWSLALLKDTIVWFCASAFMLTMRYVTAPEKVLGFRTLAADSLRLVILLEFLVSEYALPLAIELVFVPVVAIIAMLEAFTRGRAEYAIVAKIMQRLLMMAGFFILTVAIVRACADLNTLRSFDTVRSIVLVPILSVCFYPMLHLLVAYARYEHIFIRLSLGRRKHPILKRYARCQVIRHARLSLRRVEEFRRHHAHRLAHVRKRSDVDDVIRLARTSREALTPPSIDPASL